MRELVCDGVACPCAHATMCPCAHGCRWLPLADDVFGGAGRLYKLEGGSAGHLPMWACAHVPMMVCRGPDHGEGCGWGAAEGEHELPGGARGYGAGRAGGQVVGWQGGEHGSSTYD